MAASRPAKKKAAKTPAPTTRANLVLDVSTGVVEALEGGVVRVGEVLLAVEGTGTSCPGLYAAVGETGWVRVGDVVERL